MQEQKTRLGLVFGCLPTIEEIDQFMLLTDQYDVTVVAANSICGYLTQNSHFQDLRCLAMEDHDDNPTYLPGLEDVLSQFDIVILKERLGLNAFQTVKAKMTHRFRLGVWVDNLAAFPGEDIPQMKTIRLEVNNAADAFLVQTKAARQILELEGIASERIVDFTPYVAERYTRTKKDKAQALANLALPEGSFVIAQFGQIEWEEGLIDLSNGISQAIADTPSLRNTIQLLFCGVGSFADQLRSHLKALGLDDVASYVAPTREAVEAVWQACDAVFVTNLPARDRIEGDPYRILTAMAHEVPVISSRSPLVEELCGKHRIDFCLGAPHSLAQAIKKLSRASVLTNNITQKNLATVKQRFDRERARTSMLKAFDKLGQRSQEWVARELEVVVKVIEERIGEKDFLTAIDMIEQLFAGPILHAELQSRLYRNIGDCFAKLGDHGSAKEAFQKSVDLDPSAARGFIGLGTIALITGAPDAAILHFQKAIGLAADDEMANLGLGMAFQALGELKEASSWVDKALEINPENSAAIFTMVQLAYARDDFTATEKALDRFLSLRPDDQNIRYTLAGITFKQGRLTEALKMTEKLAEGNPDDQRFTELLSQIQIAIKSSREAADVSSSNG